MKVIYYIHTGESGYNPKIVDNATLKDSLREFETFIEKSKTQGTPYQNARLVVDSEKGIRVYNVGSRGGVFQNQKKW